MILAAILILMTTSSALLLNNGKSPLFSTSLEGSGVNLIPKSTSTYLGPKNGGKYDKDILQVLDEIGNFRTLLTAIGVAGLGQRMSQQLTTVFAPTDEAFSKLPLGNIDALLNDPPNLEKLLRFHVHPGRFNATRNARTFNSALKSEDGYPKQLSVKVTSWTEEVFIMTGQPNHAQVTTRGIQCTNGLIHILSEVLIPYKGNTPPQVTFMGARDLKGEETLQLGYYGSIAGTDRHGKVYDGPTRPYTPVEVGSAWYDACNWRGKIVDLDAVRKSGTGMSSQELPDW
jgi:uncharacterized surface protein with fasciclin (FAS1) repeats